MVCPQIFRATVCVGGSHVHRRCLPIRIAGEKALGPKRRRKAEQSVPLIAMLVNWGAK